MKNEKERDESGTTEGGKHNRRYFFDRVFKVVLGLWGFAFAGVVFSYLNAPSKSGEFDETSERVGPVDEIGLGEGKLVAHRREPFWVIKTGGDQIVALPATCTHLRCVLKWQKDSGRLVCPCHEGAFDLNGNVVAGPPPRPLQPLKVEIRGGVIYVSLA
jgi:Rieske Fe-S protein